MKYISKLFEPDHYSSRISTTFFFQTGAFSLTQSDTTLLTQFTTALWRAINRFEDYGLICLMIMVTENLQDEIRDCHQFLIDFHLTHLAIYRLIVNVSI
jgi:hypothetical protein